MGRFTCCYVLLHRNSTIPWFILVPQTECQDFLQLPAEIQTKIIGECKIIATFIRNNFNLEKINFAVLGNVVPQLHLHIIGRSKNDPCWPKPVWGNLSDTSEYKKEELESIRQEIPGLVITS